MRLTYLKNGQSLVLDASRCRGCGQCVDVCPHAVFTLRDGKSVIMDREACMECGACARNCANQALSVKTGVGCAAAIIGGMLRGASPTCGGATTASCCGATAVTEPPACGCGSRGQGPGASCN